VGNSAFQVEGFSEKTEGAFCHVKIHAQVHSFCGCAIWVSDGDSECCGLVLEISDVLAERALHGVESYAGKLRIRTGKNPCGLISFLGKRRCRPDSAWQIAEAGSKGSLERPGYSLQPRLFHRAMILSV